MKLTKNLLEDHVPIKTDPYWISCWWTAYPGLLWSSKPKVNIIPTAERAMCGWGTFWGLSVHLVNLNRPFAGGIGAVCSRGSTAATSEMGAVQIMSAGHATTCFASGAKQGQHGREARESGFGY